MRGEIGNVSTCSCHPGVSGEPATRIWIKGVYVVAILSITFFYATSAFADLSGKQDIHVVIADAIQTEMESALGKELPVENIDIRLSETQEKALSDYQQAAGTNKVSVAHIAVKLAQFEAVLQYGEGKNPEDIMPVNGRYEVMVNVPVPVSALRNGQVISESDISMATLPYRRVQRDYVLDITEVIGRQPARYLAAQRPIRRSTIVSPSLVKRNETVEILYQTAQLQLRHQGVALEDGTEGTLIRVKNPESGKVINATVIGPNQVRVGAVHTGKHSQLGVAYAP